MADRAFGRRSFNLGLLTAAVVAGLPRGARANGAKVLIIGGSAIKGALGMYLERDLKKLGFDATRDAKSSSGLARPDFFNWPKRASKLRDDHSPDAVVCMFGGNDAQGLWMGKDNDPEWIRWQEEGWTEEYRRRVNEFADAVTNPGTKLFWMGMPVMRSKDFDARIERMNTVFRAEMATRKDAYYLDTREVLSTPEGKYTDHLTIEGSRTRVRAGDGIHLAGAGATVVVNHLVPQIADALKPQS